MNQIAPSEQDRVHTLQSIEGLEALDLVVKLPLLLRPPETKTITSFCFKTYRPTPPVEERIGHSVDSSALRILQEAADLRGKWPILVGAGLPFWESVSVAAALEGNNK